MKWFFQALRKYAVFAGRSRRKEFWWFFFINLLIVFALKFIDILLGKFNHVSHLGPASTTYELATVVPIIAASVRRLHDTNRSGWWYLVILIPFVGWIPLSIVLAEESQPGENKYGPNPKTNMAGSTSLETGRP
jgi:uncharacterized membrane protein YhaH (DUF805 family)